MKIVSLKILSNLIEYWKDKKLAAKCGLKVEDVCSHEFETTKIFEDIKTRKCIKCGYRYKRF